MNRLAVFVLGLPALVLTLVFVPVRSARADQVRLENGDRISGTVRKVTGTEVVISPSYADSLALDRSRVQSIRLDLTRVTLNTGDVLTGRVTGETDRTLTLATSYSSSIPVRKDAVQKRKTVSKTVSGSDPVPLPGTASRAGEPAEETPEDPAGEQTTGSSSGSSNTAAGKENNSGGKSSDSLPGLAPWSGDVQFGFQTTSGNTDSRRLFARLSADYETEPFTDEIEATYLYERTEGTRSEDEAQLENQMNWNLTPRTFYFNNNRVGYDQPTGIDLFFEESLGMGYRFIKTENTKLAGQAGPGIRFEQRDDGDNEKEAVFSIRQTFEHRFSEDTKLTEGLHLLPSLEDQGEYVGDLELELSTKVNDRLDLSIIAREQYNSDPPPGKEKEDFQLITTFGFGF